MNKKILVALLSMLAFGTVAVAQASEPTPAPAKDDKTTPPPQKDEKKTDAPPAKTEDAKGGAPAGGKK
ncbi:MAG: hypothetical protein U1A78_37455 [Polyangia bacterium]